MKRGRPGVGHGGGSCEMHGLNRQRAGSSPAPATGACEEAWKRLVLQGGRGSFLCRSLGESIPVELSMLPPWRGLEINHVSSAKGKCSRHQWRERVGPAFN